MKLKNISTLVLMALIATIPFKLLLSQEKDTMYIIENGIITQAISVNNIDSIVFKKPKGLQTYSGEPLSDIDGNEYKTVKIGTQIWMAENLRVTRFNDSTIIPQVTDDTEWYSKIDTAYCYLNNDSAMYAKSHGVYYKYFAIETEKLCPLGWHVPSIDEWDLLETYLINNEYSYNNSADENIAKALASTSGWLESDNVGNVGNDQSSNNSSEFMGLPNGFRGGNTGTFYNVGSHAYWWSSTKLDNQYVGSTVHGCSISYDTKVISKDHIYLSTGGYGVRCLKNK